MHLDGLITQLLGTEWMSFISFSVAELTCTLRNAAYSHGEIVAVDACTTCRCMEGVLKCYKEECDPLSCTWNTRPDGQCCPVCLGCMSPSTSQKYYNGEQWLEDEYCTSCECINGQAYCSAVLCAPCNNPVKISGQCCPICNDSEGG